MKKTICLFLITFLFLGNSHAQVPNIFETPESLKSYLNKKSFIIPDYGVIRFDFNASDTKKSQESRIKHGADDEIIDLIFDVSIKRNNARRRDKTDYQVSFRIELNDSENFDINSGPLYKQNILLARNIIYPIKGFPSMYQLFADGDLYYSKVTWKKVPFDNYKSFVTTSVKGNSIISDDSPFLKEYSTTSYIKCLPISN